MNVLYAGTGYVGGSSEASSVTIAHSLPNTRRDDGNGSSVLEVNGEVLHVKDRRRIICAPSAHEEGC